MQLVRRIPYCHFSLRQAQDEAAHEGLPDGESVVDPKHCSADWCYVNTPVKDGSFWLVHPDSLQEPLPQAAKLDFADLAVIEVLSDILSIKWRELLLQYAALSRAEGVVREGAGQGCIRTADTYRRSPPPPLEPPPPPSQTPAPPPLPLSEAKKRI